MIVLQSIFTLDDHAYNDIIYKQLMLLNAGELVTD